MSPEPRSGMLGAIMDEYERAADDLARVLEPLDATAFEEVRDPDSKDENCRSIRTVMAHVVRATYGYADALRDALGQERCERASAPEDPTGAIALLRRAMEYTEETLQGRWGMTEKEASEVVMQTSWGVTYDLEQMLEHAIVHILRHRRQIEGYLAMPAPEAR